MYPPKAYQESEKEKLIEIIKKFPLATVISINHNEPIITHLPLVYKDNAIYGHIDKNNPQAALLQNHNKVSLIFSGPQSYISPSIFKSTQLPTWNYIKLHVKGTVVKIESEDAIKQSIVDMTTFLEAPEQKYELSLNNERMEHLVQYISGFKIENLEWEGKLKMSQDKPIEEFELAKQHLIQNEKKSIEPFINELFKK